MELITHPGYYDELSPVMTPLSFDRIAEAEEVHFTTVLKRKTL